MENTNKISYQFTAVPTKLMMLLDNNCRSMLFTLLNLSAYYANENGYFFRSNSDLQAESNLSKNLVIVTIDTLYINGIVDVKCVGGRGKTANYYKLNFDKILEYEKYSIEDTKNPNNKIETLKYKGSCYSPSYKIVKETAKEVAKSEHQKQQKVNTNIDIIKLDTLDTIYTLDNNIIKKLYITYNSKNNIKEKLTYLETIDKVELFPFIKYLILNKLIDKDFYYKTVNRTLIKEKLETYQLLELDGKANYL